MVSLIITTYNEGGNIGALVGDLLDQTRPPDELVMVDGGSSDGTVAAIEAYGERLAAAGIALNLRVEPGAGIARGRNIAVGLAAYECLCVTDAGCRLDPHWCERITRPILEGRADLVGGFFRPVHQDRFQRVLAALTVADRPPRGFMPSSRSIAFTRTAWREAGEYPEWLPWGEDTLFNERCVAAGARYEIAADAIVHWEVRPNFHAATRQFYRYAWGDGRRGRLSASHLINTGALVGSLVLAVAASPWWLLLFPAYATLLTARAARTLPPTDLPTAFGLVLGIRVARVIGWVRGLLVAARAGRPDQEV